MISRLLAWYRARGRGTKLLIGAVASVAALAVLYTVARTVQYAAASRTSPGIFVPEDADIVVRVADLTGRLGRAKETELWKSFTHRLQKDPAIRASLNEILESAGSPTIDQLEDHRWLDRHPVMRESSILRLAGRDVAMAYAGGNKFCVATRIGLFDFLLLPGLQLFPGVAGVERAELGGASVLKRGDLFVSIQGAIVLVSNDGPMLASALQRKGKADAPTGLLRATIKAEPFRPLLRGFPLGGVLAFADVETCERIDVDVEIEGADLVVRANAVGLQPRRTDPAPVDTVPMIPANGLGACVTNVETAAFWEWARKIGDRRGRGGTPLDKFARENFCDFVEILHSQGFGEEVVAKLDGPVSVLFGASEGEDGRTYAALAIYMRTSQPRDALEGLQNVIDRATEKIRKNFKPTDEEAGGLSVRSYRYEPDPLKLNDYLSVCYAVTADALILANNRGFLVDALQCRANQEPMMARQHHYEQAMRRLQQVGLKKVMGSGATASLFLYGPALRQGLEGFYSTLASKTVDTPAFRAKLREEVRKRAEAEGQPLGANELDIHVERVRVEREREMEEKLRGRARILDYLKWVAFQAEPAAGGMKLEFAIELK